MSYPQPWLSVLVPIYRVERYLAACVESVMSQTDDGVEIVLLDDCSPDRSAEVATTLCRAHPRNLRMIRHERNEGLSVARNTLLAHATGDYVWHLDPDDIMLPNAISRLRALIAASAPDLVLCDFQIIRERSGVKHVLRGERHQRSFSGESNRLDSDRSRLVAGLMRVRRMHAWTKIGKRATWQRVRFPEGRSLMQDVAAIPALVAATRTFVHVDQPWIGYRQHGASALASPSPAKIRHVLETLKDLKRDVRTLRPLDAEAEFSVDYFCIRAFAWIARKTHSTGDDSALEDACRAALLELFPDGGAEVLASCRARGWHLRAWRLRRSLREKGWV